MKRTNFATASKPKSKKGKWRQANDRIESHLLATTEKHNDNGPRLKKRRKKCRKPRQQRNTLKLCKITTENTTGKYFYHSWNNEHEASDLYESFNLHSTSVINIENENYTVYDNFSVSSHESTRHLLAFDKDTDDLIFGKVAPRQSTECLHKNMNQVRKLLEKVMAVKPNIGRGKSREGKNNAYKLFGYRKDPKGCGVGQYAFKAKTDNEVQENINAEAASLCQKMEQASSRITNSLPETEIYRKVQTFTDAPTVATNGISTAFSIGRNYWSKSHIDHDYYFTTLSCLSSESSQHKEILYYFIFPEYKVVIPMRSGEVLIFNPLITHSCSNPRFRDAFIFSAYVSTKTVLTKASETFLTNH